LKWQELPVCRLGNMEILPLLAGNLTGLAGMSTLAAGRVGREKTEMCFDMTKSVLILNGHCHFVVAVATQTGTGKEGGSCQSM
jgi:hypothetical protein